jgi:hypothetical protein
LDNSAVKSLTKRLRTRLGQPPARLRRAFGDPHRTCYNLMLRVRP